MTDDFETALATLRAMAVPSDGDNLQGFQIDLEYALEELAGWEVLSVRRDPAVPGGVQASASCPREVFESGEAEGALVRVWSDCLRYRHGACHRVGRRGDTLVLEFATAMGPGGLFVRGEIRVRASPG